MSNTLIGCSGEFDGIVKEVEKKMGYSFSDNEIEDILSFTVKKCEINRKGLDYAPILFENELRDYIMRTYINARGILNIKSRAAASPAAV